MTKKQSNPTPPTGAGKPPAPPAPPALLAGAENIINSGIVTLNNWTMCPDGQVYLYLFCRDWLILTDKTFPVEGFGSSEKWQLVGKDKNGEVKALIPGCQVKGFVFCAKKPAAPNCYEI